MVPFTARPRAGGRPVALLLGTALIVSMAASTAEARPKKKPVGADPASAAPADASTAPASDPASGPPADPAAATAPEAPATPPAPAEPSSVPGPAAPSGDSSAAAPGTGIPAAPAPGPATSTPPAQPAPPAPPQSAGLVEGSKWELVAYFHGDTAKPAWQPADPSHYAIAFGPAGRAQLQLDCNSGMGEWAATPPGTAGTLAITHIGGTKMACPAPSEGGHFAALLSQSKAYRMQEAHLLITLGGPNDILAFRPAAGGPTAIN